MKTQILVAAALMFGSPAFSAGEKHDGAHGHKPLHGGVEVATKHMNFELVAKAAVIQLYLSDHDKAVDMAKTAGKRTLLTGSEKQKIELKPAGDKLEASGTYKVTAGTKAVAVVTVAGKAAAARFSLK